LIRVVLKERLTSPQYGYSSKSQVQLERKEDMKARGCASPDSGDTLAMTFSVKVAPKPKESELRDVSVALGYGRGPFLI
jgi:hypothetical protein